MIKEKMIEWFKLKISKIPIIGALANISKKAQIEAFVEMLVTVIFSTLPIWFGGAILTINAYFENLDKLGTESFLGLYIQYILLSISNGELLMYAAATLGPTLYLGLSSFGKSDKPFPWVRSQLVIAIIINVFATVLFFMARDKGYASQSSFVHFTLMPYFLSLILLFPAMAFEHEKKFGDVREMQQEEQDGFMAGYRQHRG